MYVVAVVLYLTALLAMPLVLIAGVFASTFNTVNGTIIQVLVPDAVAGPAAKPASSAQMRRMTFRASSFMALNQGAI